jgi:hypothetical protein
MIYGISRRTDDIGQTTQCSQVATFDRGGIDDRGGSVLSFSIALLMGPGCVALLAVYLALSLSYSFRLKREPIIDVLILATLFQCAWP